MEHVIKYKFGLFQSSPFNSLRTAHVFPVVASNDDGEIRLRFAGYFFKGVVGKAGLTGLKKGKRKE